MSRQCLPSYTFHSDSQAALTVTHSEKRFVFDPVRTCLCTCTGHKSFMQQRSCFLNVIRSDNFQSIFFTVCMTYEIDFMTLNE